MPGTMTDAPTHKVALRRWALAQVEASGGAHASAEVAARILDRGASLDSTPRDLVYMDPAAFRAYYAPWRRALLIARIGAERPERLRLGAAVQALDATAETLGMLDGTRTGLMVAPA